MRAGEEVEDRESWHRYWGTTEPLSCSISLGLGVRGFQEQRRMEGEFEIIESESGAITRQVPKTYGMPEFVVYPERDRQSWEF